jgi:hypothetical protein
MKLKEGDSMDTVFRQKQDVVQQQEQEAVPQAPRAHVLTPVDTGVEVPFTDYQRAHQKPYTVEYFGLSNLWDDPQGGFIDEVGAIEKYFQHKIDTGQMSNDIESVKQEIRQLEKINNLSKENRVSIKLGVLSSYVKFLLETEGIRYNARRYAHS